MSETISLREKLFPHYGLVLRAGTLLIVVVILAWLGLKFAYGAGLLTSIWTPDAIVLAVLLRAPRKRWGLYILTGFFGCTAVDAIAVGHLQPAAIISGISSLTTIVAAFLLAGFDQRIDLTRRNDLIKFILAAALCGPAVSATVVTLYALFYYHAATMQAWINWFLQHALGFMIVTPPLLMVKLHDLRHAFGSKERAGLLKALALVTVTTAVIFWQTSYSLLFFVYPALTFATFRGGFVGASLGIFLIAIIAIAMTLTEHGPFMLIQGDYGVRILILQVFLVVTFLSSMPIAIALGEVRKSQQEMTEARHDLAEQNRLLQLAERTANFGHWRLDLATSEMFWSDETYRIHGLEKSAYAPSVESVLEFYHPDDREKIHQAGERAITRHDGTNIVLRVILPNNETRYVESLTRCEFDENGKARMLFGVSHDITAAKQTEQALIEALEEAQRANRAKSDFLASMSHELRTPLNAVIGFSELLLHHPNEHLSEHQTEYLGYILRGGNQLLQLVKDVLDLSTIEAGRLHISIQDVDLAELMEELETTLAPLAQQKGLTFTPAALPQAMPPLRADHGRLLQVLINLGTNAIKYNKPDGWVRIYADRVADGRVRISVSDSGKGIPANRQAELFQPFNRLGSESSGIEGTGIGLSICKRLMDLMGGSIGFTSAPDAGSTFWIEIAQVLSALPASI